MAQIADNPVGADGFTDLVESVEYAALGGEELLVCLR